MIDTSTAFGRQVDRRLREELVIWLTTVGSDGSPHPSPVWFLWDGETFFLYSYDNTARVLNIRRNPRVSLNLIGSQIGGDTVIVNGDAEIVRDAPPAGQNAEYVAKYRSQLLEKGLDEFERRHPVAIRIRPTRMRLSDPERGWVFISASPDGPVTRTRATDGAGPTRRS